jgi:hypothetical protein
MGLPELLGHRGGDARRVMPHQALEQLITPTDAYFIVPVGDVPFGLCAQGQTETAQSGQYKKNLFHAAKVQKNIELCKYVCVNMTNWQKKMHGTHFVLAYMDFFL